jgi:fructoselysine-6-P-deglycase FrlB-like protein
MNATTEEAASQPDVWRVAAARVDEFRDSLAVPGERVLAIGCGTSAFVAESYAVLRERAGLGETDWCYASEMPPRRSYDRVIAITRSGTTTEVLDALRSLPATTRRVAVTAVTGKPVEELVDECVRLDFADETSVVQTRFPTTVLALARAAFGEEVDRVISDGHAAVAMPEPIDPAKFEHFVFLGTGWTVGLAHEAALKVREMARGWSESYPARDFRHGPVAAISERSLVWTFGDVPRDVTEAAEAAGGFVHREELDPLAQLVLVHRLALRLANHRGFNPDQPRHLTRSVVLR